MISRLKGLLFRARGSAELASIHLVCKLPIHFLRIWILKLWGADIGSQVIIYHGLEARSVKGLRIGDRTIIGNDAILDARGGLEIGADVNLSTGVSIWSAQHDWKSPTFDTVYGRVFIGDRAWLSGRTTVLPNVTVGAGAVVAAHAVVSKDVPENMLVGGIPARVIGTRPRMNYRLPGRRLTKAYWW